MPLSVSTVWVLRIPNFRLHLLHERTCILPRLAASNLQAHLALRPVDSDVQIAFLCLVRHLRQVFDVDMYVAGFVALARLVKRLLILSRVLPGPSQRRHPAPLEHARRQLSRFQRQVQGSGRACKRSYRERNGRTYMPL